MNVEIVESSDEDYSLYAFKKSRIVFNLLRGIVLVLIIIAIPFLLKWPYKVDIKLLSLIGLVCNFIIISVLYHFFSYRIRSKMPDWKQYENRIGEFSLLLNEIKINILLDNKAYFRLLYTFKKYDFYNSLFLDIVKKTEMLVSQKIKNLNKSIAIWVGVLIILSIFKIRTYYYYMFSVAVLFFLITNIKIIRDTIYTPIIGFHEINKIK